MTYLYSCHRPLFFFVSVCVFVCKCCVCFEGFMVTLTKSMIFMRCSETKKGSKSTQISWRKLRISCFKNLKIIRTQSWHETWGNSLVFFINHLRGGKRRRIRNKFPYKGLEKLENKLKKQHWQIKHNHELIHKTVSSRSQIYMFKEQNQQFQANFSLIILRGKKKNISKQSHGKASK